MAVYSKHHYNYWKDETVQREAKWFRIRRLI